jgi:MOSC domain-containing protein YiiM
MSAHPTILAVSLNPSHGFSKQPQLAINLIAGEGVEGDAHRGATTQHLYLKRKDPAQPNLAQVHLLASELLEELRAKGFDLAPGDLGENILTQGADLLSLPAATRLHLGANALLELTSLRTPCSQIDRFREGLQQYLWGERSADGKRPRRAGVMAIVLQGGLVYPNDVIRLQLPPGPHKPLGPV